MTTKFYQYYVTNSTAKVRVSYSLDNRTDGRKCVTIYAKDYDRKAFRDIFGDIAKNDSDIMTDYFEQSRATLFEDNILYPTARKKVEQYLKKIAERRRR